MQQKVCAAMHVYFDGSVGGGAAKIFEVQRGHLEQLFVFRGELANVLKDVFLY